MLYFILFLLIILIISLFKTRWGLFLILFLLPAYLIRREIFSVPTTFLELSIYFVFLVWLFKAIFSKNLVKKIRRIYRVIRPFLIPIALFFGAAILATVISPDKRLSLGVLKGWFLDPLLVLILFLDLVRRKKEIKAVVLTLFLSASYVAIYGLYEYIFRVGLDSDGRLNSFFVPANYVAMYIAPILVLSLIFWKRINSKFLFVAYYFLLIATLLALYFTKSYGGWLGLFGALLFLWFRIKIPIKRLKYLLIFALLVILVSVSESDSPKFGRLLDFSTRTSSSTRAEIWQTSLLIIKEHPFWGVGLGNFETIYREYVPRVAFPPLEWLVVKPHNLYLALWIEMGILGLASFIWLIIIFFKQGWRKKDNPIVKYALAAMIALLAHGLVDTPYFKNDLSALFWVIVGALAVIARSEWSERRSNPINQHKCGQCDTV